MRCPGVAASNWYGGRRTTTTSPLRLGCSESLPSTLRSSSLSRMRSTTLAAGLAGSVRFWNALTILARTWACVVPLGNVVFT